MARPTAPVSVATSTRWVAPELLRVGHRVAQDQAALGVGVDDVDPLAVERPDDVAGPGRVAAGHVLDRGGDARAAAGRGESRAAVAMAAITVHAPVLSIFISSIRSAGLMLMPPESKQTPLPTSARCRPSASFSPSPPDRMTIIRGGLSLPCPTARNMPMPSSAARRSSTTSIHRPWASAMARASSASTCGRDVVRGAVGEAAGDVGALADDPAALGAALGVAGDGVRPATRSRLVQGRRGGVAVLAVDRLGLEGALDDAAGDQLGREGDVAAERRPRSAPSQTAIEPTSRPTSRRIAVGGEAAGGLAVELVGRAARRPTSTRLDGQVARGREGGRRSAWPASSPKRGERPELAPGAAVELVEDALEVGLADDRDDEELGGSLPRLRGDDADLHAGPPGARGRGQAAGRVSGGEAVTLGRV